MGRTSPPSTIVLGSGAKSFPYASLIVARRAPLFNFMEFFGGLKDTWSTPGELNELLLPTATLVPWPRVEQL